MGGRFRPPSPVCGSLILTTEVNQSASARNGLGKIDPDSRISYLVAVSYGLLNALLLLSVITYHLALFELCRICFRFLLLFRFVALERLRCRERTRGRIRIPQRHRGRGWSRPLQANRSRGHRGDTHRWVVGADVMQQFMRSVVASEKETVAKAQLGATRLDA